MLLYSSHAFVRISVASLISVEPPLPELPAFPALPPHATHVKAIAAASKNAANFFIVKISFRFLNGFKTRPPIVKRIRNTIGHIF